jgi:choline dehydrogenase-like flavoprotein
MDNNEIYVPLLSWLIGGTRIGGGYNYYTASKRTDPMTGCIKDSVFNYRVWIEKLDEQEFLKAAVYFGSNSFECQNEDDMEITTYEMEEESRELIRSWLKEKYDAFLAENS